MDIKSYKLGFTLIELSIVLVIIGLIVGGILVGQDLIQAAAIRAQISQIEKYNSAVNTFRAKYGYLPGDIPEPQASQFGFKARGTTPGQGDGNGVIEGLGWPATTSCGSCTTGGEAVMFWEDLTAGNALIDGNFNTASISSYMGAVSAANVGLYLPSAKIGNGNYVYVWSGGYTSGFQWSSYVGGGDGQNYYGLIAVTTAGTGGSSPNITSAPALSVKQAYNIDSKIDDGLPQSGKVKAIYEAYNEMWWAIGGGGAVATIYAPSTPGAAEPASATSCFDNGNTANATNQYSMEQNGGSGINCALSFKFQ